MSKIQNINVDKIIFEHILCQKSNISEVVTKILKHCNNTVKLIIAENEQSLKLLFEIMYILNYLYRVVGLLQLVNRTDVIKILDDVLGEYYSNFFSNDNIKKCVIKLKQKSKNTDELLFFDKLLKKFELTQNNTIKIFNNQ